MSICPPGRSAWSAPPYFTGNLLGTLLAGRLIARCGFNRSYYLASALFAAGCVGLGITLTFWSWLAWRFIAGVGCAMIWVVVESALMCSGNARNRGRLLAAYMMVYYVGTVLGQLLVSKVPTSLMAVLPWVTALVLTAMLPLLFTRIASPSGNHQARTRSGRCCACVRRVWGERLHPLRHRAGGALWSDAALSEPPGVSDGAIGYWMAVMVSAGILGQWPVGRLADRFGRLPVLRVQVLVVILGPWRCSATQPWDRCCSFWGRGLHALSGGHGLGLREGGAASTGGHEPGRCC